MSEKKYTIGIDYGTDSVRSLIVDTSGGEEIATHVFYYPRWKEGLYCNPSENRFRQHPLDYIEGLEVTIIEALNQAGPEVARRVRGISVDTTGSTPVAVNRDGIPLSLTPGFEKNPNAMFILWKDHTAVREAAEINQMAKEWGGTDYTKYEGGIYSSEWFWAKILHILREDEAIRSAAFSWVEHCDWIPGLLTGNSDPLKLKRSRCAAGHKAMWHEEFDGLPSEEFLSRLDPLLGGMRDRLFKDTYECTVSAGRISPEWARKLGLPYDVEIGTGAFDAHLGALGGEIRPYYLSKVMGTSTCDMLVAPEGEMKGKLVAGICGQVDGSIVPGMVGLEAGQSAFGDVYAWFGKLMLWPVREMVKKMDWLDPAIRERLEKELSSNIIDELSRQAALIPPEKSTMLALDWLNGRRTPDANQELKAALTGLSLGSDAPAVFRALVEATAFGSRMINERFINEGVRIDGIIALGGVAKKSAFVMQIVADVLNMPIKIARSEQTCALGSAMAAAVVSGVHASIEDAQKAMGGGMEKTYYPDEKSAEFYNHKYEQYKQLGVFIENELQP